MFDGGSIRGSTFFAAICCVEGLELPTSCEVGTFAPFVRCKKP